MTETMIDKRTANAADDELEFYDAKGVAEIMRVSLPTAREFMHRKDFPLIRVGRQMRVSKQALREWAMQKHT